MTQPERPSVSREQAEHLYKRLAAAALGLMIVGTVAYRLLEDWSWVDSFYFSAIAVTTVGFGDITPSSDGSKLFTVAYILAGISIFATYLDTRMKYHAAKRHARRED